MRLQRCADGPLQLQRDGATFLFAAPQRQRDETTMTEIDSILAPACRALFGGTPAELGIALPAAPASQPVDQFTEETDDDPEP